MSDKKVMVSPIARGMIDAWLVAEAGFPARVVHCARGLNLQTVGELRRLPPERMLAERRFGRRSLAAVEDFFKTCADLEAGRVGFNHVREVFTLLLPAKTWETLRLRYGMNREEMEASRNFHTLQSIANRDGLTRERVRQVVENGMERLGSRLARAFLSPFEDRFIAVLKSCGGIADAEAFGPLAQDAVLEGLNPASTALLLADAHPDRWTCFGMAFILAPAATVETFAANVRDLAAAGTKPVAASEWEQQARSAGLGDFADGGKTAVLIEQMEDLVLLRDGSCMPTKRLPAYLERILRDMGGRASYAAVADRLNRLLQPYCRRSPQSVHRSMALSNRFQSTQAPGEFTLKKQA